MQKRTAPQNVFNVCNIAIMVLLMIVTLYPFYYVIVASFTSSAVLEVHTGMLWWPVNFTCKAFEVAFSHPLLLSGFKNILIIMVVSVPLSLVMTILCAYFMVSKGMLFKKPLMYLMLFTMFFGGGLVPSYLNIQMLGMRDTIWAMILPGAISAYNVVVFRTFFKGIPDSLAESATIDGAGHFRVLFSIILPLSKALLATFTLFSVVGYWNDYMSALLYLDSESKFPIQLFLRKILNSMRMDDIADYSLLTQLQRVNTSTVQNAAIIITIVPILCVYPFLQKHFAKGVLIGSVKG